MITVAICTYNRAQRLGQTLDEMVRQHVSPSIDWEILVVDNASTDDTAEVVDRFRERAEVTVRYVREPRQGLSHARNTAVRVARADIVAFTDDDVIPEPDWLSALVDAFRAHDCSGVGGRVLERWEFEPPEWWTEIRDEVGAAIVSFDPGGGSRPLEQAPFGANMAFRREVFERHGGFRTDLGRSGDDLLSGEDTEFGRRLLRAGEVLWYAPAAVVHHPVSPDRARKAYFRRWCFQFGRTLVRRDGLPEDAPRFLGIPRYMFRELSEEIAMLATRWSGHRRFLHELRVRKLLGRMAESRRRHGSSASVESHDAVVREDGHSSSVKAGRQDA